MNLSPEAAQIKFDIFRAILASQGGSAEPGSAAAAANHVFDALFGDKERPTVKPAKKSR